MKVAIVGSRGFAKLSDVDEYVSTLEPGTVIVSGAARGVDAAAAAAAHKYGLGLEEYPADWKRLGMSAGFQRNATIIAAADRVVAFWDGKSRGTMDTVKKAHKANKPVEIRFATET